MNDIAKVTIDAAHGSATFSCQIESVSALSANTYEVKLKAPGDVVLDYTAGYYLKLELDVNNNGEPLPLFYSIANSPNPADPHHLVIFVQKTSEFSSKIIKSLSICARDKKSIRVTLPLGQSFLQTDLSLPHMLVAAGSGIAKIKSLTEAILKQRPDADVKVYWSNRSADDFYLLDKFQSWVDDHENFSFTPILEAADTNWTGRSGYIYEVIEKDVENLGGTYAYLCGSPGNAP